MDDPQLEFGGEDSDFESEDTGFREKPVHRFSAKTGTPVAGRPVAGSATDVERCHELTSLRPNHHFEKTGVKRRILGPVSPPGYGRADDANC